jgi:hypothetical protein
MERGLHPGFLPATQAWALFVVRHPLQPELPMSIDAEVLNSESVDLLCGMYETEYTSQSLARMRDPVPSMLNALGSCAGFAAQVAVWRTLVLPTGRNPGDFFVYVGKPNEILFYGEAINQFLISTPPDRLSFLSLAASTLRNASELFDIGELAGHVAQTVGTEDFGIPRVPPSVDLPELPRAALARTWGKATHILEACRPAEWPALLGAAAYYHLFKSGNAGAADCPQNSARSSNTDVEAQSDNGRPVRRPAAVADQLEHAGAPPREQSRNPDRSPQRNASQACKANAGQACNTIHKSSLPPADDCLPQPIRDTLRHHCCGG